MLTQIGGVAAGVGAASGGLVALSAALGYTTVTVESQYPAAMPGFIAGSAVQVAAAYFDTTGNPLIPNSVKWSVTDAGTCKQLAPWVALKPGFTNTVHVTSAQNQMVSFSRPSEVHRVIFQVIDIAGNVEYAFGAWAVTRICGAPLVADIEGIAAQIGAAIGSLT